MFSFLKSYAPIEDWISLNVLRKSETEKNSIVWTVTEELYDYHIHQNKTMVYMYVCDFEDVYEYKTLLYNKNAYLSCFLGLLHEANKTPQIVEFTSRNIVLSFQNLITFYTFIIHIKIWSIDLKIFVFNKLWLCLYENIFLYENI